MNPQRRKLVWIWTRVLALMVVLCLIKVLCDALYDGIF
jgi:hypothetical protein